MFSVILALHLLFQTGINTENSGTKLSKQADVAAIVLPELKLEGIPLQIFTHTIRAAGGSGGIAHVDSGCSNGSPQSVLIEAGTPLGQALDKITSAIDSKWHIDAGVVNIFPATGVPSLLETKVHHFEWDKTASPNEAISRLVNMPEVAEKARELGLKIGNTGGGASEICIVGPCPTKEKPVPALEKENDATLLFILNRIAATHGSLIWTYLQRNCGNETSYVLYASSE